MIRIAVWSHDLSDPYLHKVTQLGADCIDGVQVPIKPGKGYFDLNELLKIKKKIHSWGLDINRVSLPWLSEKFMEDREGAEDELDNCCKSVQVFGEAGAPLARVHFANDTFPWMNKRYEALHRGGYRQRGESLALTEDKTPLPPLETLAFWWQRLCIAYEKLVSVAEEYGVKLMMHPSDTPNADAPLGSLGFHRIIGRLSQPLRRVSLLLRHPGRSRWQFPGAGRDPQLRPQGAHFRGPLPQCPRQPGHCRRVRGSSPGRR